MVKSRSLGPTAVKRTLSYRLPPSHPSNHGRRWLQECTLLMKYVAIFLWYESSYVFHTRRIQERIEGCFLFCFGFGFSASKRCIIVEGGKDILVGDVGVTITDAFKYFVLWERFLRKIVSMLCMLWALKPELQKRGVDFCFVFFYLFCLFVCVWAPEVALLKSKMIHVSFKDANKFQSIKH